MSRSARYRRSARNRLIGVGIPFITAGPSRSNSSPSGIAAIASTVASDVSTSPELRETPAYFKKEVKQSQEMNYEELARYIKDLQQSGFDVVRLKVQLNMKFAYPVITFVMALLAVPFALSTGRRGALTGVAVAIGIAIVYFVASGLFEAMGNANQLPAAMAAWAPDIIFGLGGGYLVLKVRT